MARITAGAFKGRVLRVSPQIRPTEAKVRQAFFNILGPFIHGARMVDGFAGSGAMGLEALSRGAAFVAFIESENDPVVSIRDNLALVEQELDRGAWRVLQLDIARGLQELAKREPPFDVIFFDPPYRSDEGKKALNSVVECAILAPSGLVAIEHERQAVLPESIGFLRHDTQHRYGDTVLSLYRAPA